MSRAAKGIRVALTCAGAKVSLARAFAKAGAVVFPVDSDPTAALCQMFSCSGIAPPVGERAYEDFLVEFCDLNEIDLVVPTHDWDLAALTEVRDRLLMADVLLASRYVVETTSFRVPLMRALLDAGIPARRAWYAEEAPPLGVEFPIEVVSRRLGGERNEKPIGRLGGDELHLAPLAYALQEQIEPVAVVDTFSCPNGRVVSLIPRSLHKVKGGEPMGGTILGDGRFAQLAVDAVETLRVVGPAMVKFGVRREEVVVLDVRPRFGGSIAAAGKAAGVDHVFLAVQHAVAQREGGEPLLEVKEWTPGRSFVRYLEEVVR